MRTSRETWEADQEYAARHGGLASCTEHDGPVYADTLTADGICPLCLRQDGRVCCVHCGYSTPAVTATYEQQHTGWPYCPACAVEVGMVPAAPVESIKEELRRLEAQAKAIRVITDEIREL